MYLYVCVIFDKDASKGEKGFFGLETTAIFDFNHPFIYTYTQLQPSQHCAKNTWTI